MIDRGQNNQNAFYFGNFILRQIKIVNGNQTTVNLNIENLVRAYAETLKELKFDDDGLNTQNKDFENHFQLFLELTSTQDTNVETYFPDEIGAGIHSEL